MLLFCPVFVVAVEESPRRPIPFNVRAAACSVPPTSPLRDGAPEKSATQVDEAEGEEGTLSPHLPVYSRPWCPQLWFQPSLPSPLSDQIERRISAEIGREVSAAATGIVPAVAAAALAKVNS